MSSTSYRGRFAPSPSGPLHLGSFLTALASYLDARANAGEWLVRIDDLDPCRSRPGISDRILYQLEAIGLQWDRDVVYQSARTALYQEGLARLTQLGDVYACSCSRNEMIQRIYPGTCRKLGLPMNGEGLALRIRVNQESVTVHDRIQGQFTQNLDQTVGDFVIFRKDGVHAYHLATVLDDSDQGITQIVRGADLLESTPRQIYLQRLLGLAHPVYAHTPLLVDSSGRKLSKSQLPDKTTDASAKAMILGLLELLQISPPPEVRGSTRDEILSWAIDNWAPERLRGPHEIAVSDFRLS